MPSRLYPAVVLIILCTPFAIGCDATEPDDGRIVAGVDLDALFAPPTLAEIDAVLDEWSKREIRAQDVQVVADVPDTVGGVPMRLRIVQHAIDGGVHFGAIAVPADAEAGDDLPILLFAHGGDQGVNLKDLDLFVMALAELGDDFVLVVPSFRSEHLVHEGTTYASGGSPSPWDRDVDDALMLIDATRDLAPEADPEQIGVVGFSRGGGVALLMGIRDPRIDLVVDFFGPTDFFGPFVQEVARDALQGRVRDLPGAAFLDSAYVRPLKAGDTTVDAVRLELARRSAVLFAGALPGVQVHHGAKDRTVPVSQAHALREVMQSLGRSGSSFEFYVYPNGGHEVFQLPGSIERTRAFVGRLLSAGEDAS